MLTVSFIRHGESEDNLKSIWAGWKDAPLSELGRRQAAAVGKYYSAIPLTHVYASPLLRARATGEAVHGGQQGTPPFTLNPNLREQHFGVAEGKPWTIAKPKDKTIEECIAAGIYPVLYERHEKFPDGESLDDLARRTEQALRETVLLHLTSGKDGHIALASHGLCISETVAALLRLDPESRRDVSYAGLRNTGWTRAEVSIRDPDFEGEVDVNNPPALYVKITHVNQYPHLEGILRRQPVEQDDKKTAFFAGKRDSLEGSPSV